MTPTDDRNDRPTAAELLVASVSEYWTRITGHHFLAAVAGNSLESETFARWVAADYAFNLEYLRFGAGLLTIAPDLDASRVLGRHLQITQATVDLLITVADAADVELDVEPGPFTLGLSSYLRSLLPRGFELSLVALYCAERVYFDAWSAVASRANKEAAYWPLIEHLSAGSKEDLDSIESLVNRIATDDSAADLRATFEMVVRFELLFWNEVFTGPSW
jgi:formylaminopyrimidine deformylase / aminopyrimidine aminohydrolase